MKSTKNILKVAVVLLSLLIVQSTFAIGRPDRSKTSQQGIVTIKGKVVDAVTGNPLIFASVAVKETNVAIVTNVDGEFTLKLNEPVATLNLEITFLGYKNRIVAVSSLKDNSKNVISLEMAPIPLSEVIVKPLDPEFIVREAIGRIGKNYESVANLMTAFYRETIRKNKSYVSIGEAVVEIFKAPYNNDLRFDGARIYKGRKNSDVEKMDTILFKLQGGPVNALQLDLIKNNESILTQDAMKYYNYSLTKVIEIDDKPHYVINFVQKPDVEMPLFMGTLYINIDTYGITEAEFGFNLSDIEAASSIFIKKRPLGVSVTPEIVTYRAKYREQDGKLHFAYSRAELKFKVDWKKKLFNTYYTTMSEIAITDRTSEEVIKIASKDKIKYSDIFSESVKAFTDPQFWGDYNVIEPDQSIESAIRKLNRKLKFSDREKE